MLSESLCIFAKVLVLLQRRVADLELQLSELEKKNAGLHKNLKDCHAVLVATKVDPGIYVSPFQSVLLSELFQWLLERNFIIR